MNKLATYVLLILLFLGASHSFIPEHIEQQYIYDESNYSDFFRGSPISVILIDAYRAGLVIKSNIHRYRIVNVFDGTIEIDVRVSKKYFKRSIQFIGHSIFRRNEKGVESITPAPPGILLVGQPAYGRWVQTRAGSREWRFYRAYRYLENQYLWGDFKPTLEFYKQYRTHQQQDIPFSGPNDEFGPEGSVSTQVLELKWYKSRDDKFSFQEYIDTFFKIPMLRN